MKICILDGKTLGDDCDFSVFKKFGQLSVFDETSPSEVSDRVRYFDIVIDNKVIIDKNAIKSSKSLKLIALFSTGTNVVDIDAARDYNVGVCNAAGYSTPSVQQHTFAMLFELWERLSKYDGFVKSGEYGKSSLFTSYLKQFNEINGKRWGIIGYGAIGSSVAQAAEVFGAEVVFYSLSGKGDCDGFKSISLEELLKTSDIVSIHCALSERTKNLISERELSVMKSNAVVINVGRGGIINEAALANAVDSGIIGGACLDVFEKEPVNNDNPLLNVRNCDRIVLTPHIAWASIEARNRLIDEVHKNIDAFVSGKNRNRVV